MTYNGSFVHNLLRILLAIMALSLFVWKGNAQSMVSNWVIQSDHTFEDYTYSVAADTLGDYIYIGGSIEQITDATVADFGNTTGSSIIHSSMAGGREAFLCKMDMTGNILWFLTLGGNQNDAVLDVCVGADGNIYFAGYYDGNFKASDLDGSNQASLSESGGGGESNCFIGSYSPSGTLRWLKQEGGTQNDKYFSISSTSDGIVALGTFFENNNETLLGQNITSSNNDEDVFIAKYGFDGSNGWLIAGGSEESDYDHAMDAADLHYSLTSYRDTLYFMTSFMGTSYNFDYATNYNSINTAFNITSTQAEANFALGAITNDGKVIWLRRQLQNDNNPHGMAVAADCNGVFAAGLAGDELYWEGPSTGWKSTVGSADVFVCRYNRMTGAPEWYRLMSNSTSDADIPSDIITDIKGNIYICGINHSNATIGGGTLTGETNGAGYVLSLNKDGLYRSRILFNTTGTSERVTSIALAKNLEILAVGWGIGNIASGQSVSNTSNDSFWSYINNTPVVSATCCSGISFTCLPNQTITLTAGCTATLPNYLAAYTGATCPAYTYAQNPIAGTALNSGTHPITISNALNQVICTFTVTVADPPPVVICPPSQTLPLGPGCSVMLPDYSYLFSGTTDNCTSTGNFTFAQSPPAGTIYTGQQWVALGMTITDAQGNSSSCSFLVTIVDNTAPIMSCLADTTIELSSGCSTIFNYNLPSATDNCVSCTAASIPGFTYLNTLNGNHYYRSNTSANWATANANCIANGGHLMTITSPGENAIANALLNQCWIGLSDVANEGTFQWVTGEALSYTNWVLLQPDNLFNQDYVVINSVLPGLWSDESGTGSYPYLLEIECPYDAPLVQLESGIPTGGNFTTGTHTITFRATDSMGNTSFCDFQVSVVDAMSPTITCPTVSAVLLNGNCNFVLPDYRSLASVTDNCTPTANLVVSQYPLPGSILGGPGFYTIFLRVEDLSGNFDVCSFVLEIEDNTPPSIQCPPNITVNATDCNATVTYSNPTATSSCVSCAPDALPGYTLIGDYNGHRYFRSESSVSWPDAYSQSILTTGHLAEVTSDEEVAFLENAGIAWIGLTDIDEEMNFQWISGQPFIYSNWANNDPNDYGGEDFVLINWLPGGKWIDGGNTTNWPFILEFDCTDNTPAITQINGLASGSSFTIGSHPITYVATDQAGNSASCTFTINVNDIAPTITCPGNQLIPSGTNCQAILPSYRHLAVITDNCSLVDITDVVQTPPPGTIVTGTTTVMLTVTDDTGMTAQCTFTVSPADTTAPVIVPPTNLFPNVSGSCAFVLPDYRIGAITDNCTSYSSMVKTQFPAPGVTIHWPTQVYITATDASGNTSVISFVITPTDTVPPSIGCNPDIVLANQAGVCESPVDFNISFTENCSCNAPASIPGFVLIGTFNGHTYFRSTGTLTWQNAYNNAVALGAHLVTISSEEENEFLPNSTTNYWIGLTDKYSEGSFQWVTGEPLAFENWEDGEPNNTNDEDYVHTNHLNPFEWNDEDATSSRRYIIEFDCAASELEPRGIVHFESGDLDVEYDETVVFPVDTTAVEFIITDYSGLADTCYFNVIIQDASLPFITCENTTVNTEDGLPKVRVPNQTKAEELGYVIDPNDINAMENFDITGIDNTDLECYYYLDIDHPNVDDNCGVGSVWNSYSGSDEIHAYFPCGTTEVMWYVQDIYNNVDSCLSYVIVNDNTPPVIDCEDYVEVPNLPDICDGYAVVNPPQVLDECGSVAIWNDYNGTSDASDTYQHWLTNVEFRVTDESGNASWCTTVVDVLDVQAPTIDAAPFDTLEMDAFCQAIIPDYATIYPVFENCIEGHIFAQSPGAGNTASDGDIVHITIMDAHNQISEYDIQIVLEDTIAPEVFCPGDIVVSVAAGDPDVFVTVPPATFNDNCGALAIQTTVDGLPVFTPSGMYTIGVHTVEWTAADGNGNASTCSMTITVNTNDFPTISCPADIEVSNDPNQCGAYVTVPMPGYSDDGITSIPEHNSTFSDSGINNASGFYPVGSHTITWTTTDDSGNVSFCDMTIVVNDEELPVVACPGATIITLPVGVCMYSTTGLSQATLAATDNCEVDTIFSNIPALLPVGTTLVTWTIRDVHGNTATCVQQIHIIDSEFPVISCPADMSFVLPNGQCQIPSTSVNIGSATATDNCGTPVITRLMPANFTSGVNSVVWTATDANGHASSCTQLITIQDFQPPQINCPPDITIINASGACVVDSDSVAIGLATAVDNCAVAEITHDIPAYFNIGNNYVTWTATDVNNNTSTCTQIVFVDDTEPPVITCPDTLFTQADPGTCSVLTSALNIHDVTATDNCTYVTVTDNAPVNLSVGIHNITYTAEDNFGNTATCNRVIVVRDNENPIINCPSDVIVSNESGLRQIDISHVNPGMATATDNCEIDYIENDAPITFPIGVTIVNWTAYDIHGNHTSCQQNITVEDNDFPTIVCPNDVTGYTTSGSCSADSASIVLGIPAMGDNCGIGAFNHDGPALYPLGNTIVNWTVTDVNGNSTSCAQTVSIEDLTIPDITCPASITASAESTSCGIPLTSIVLGTPLVQDNCTTPVYTNDAPSYFNIGTTTVTWTVTDDANNSSSCTQLVQVMDVTPPQITCASDVVTTTSPGECAATGLILSTPGIIENCGLLNLTNDAPANFPVGTTFVTWIATDLNGLTDTCTQQVIVSDNQHPVFACNPSQTIATNSGICEITLTEAGIIAPTATDNCGAPIVTSDAPAILSLGLTTITWTATDMFGLTSECVQDVFVIDNEPPIIICASDTTLKASPGQCGILLSEANLSPPFFTDNCNNAVLSNDAPALLPLGTTLVTWTATDANGLFTQCSQEISVLDMEAPQLNCNPSITVSLPQDSCIIAYAEINIVDPIATDNCSITTVTNDAPAIFTVGTTTIKWTATDAAGNSTECFQDIIVMDTQVPFIQCPAPITISSDPSECGIAFEDITLPSPLATDNCGTPALSHSSTSLLPIGSTLITWTATDVNGLTNTCYQEIIVVDSMPPTILCPSDIETDATISECGISAGSVSLGIPSVTDNCSIQTYFNDTPLYYPVGTTNVVWTVVDAGGLSNTCVQSVKVSDHEFPTIMCPDDLTLNAAPGLCGLPSSQVILEEPTVDDNCAILQTLNAMPLMLSIGQNDVQWTTTDIHGNSTSCIQRIWVLDNQNPILNCAPDITVNVASNNCEISSTQVTLVAPLIQENCTIASLVNNAPANYPVGTTVVTWTATDSNGLTGTCTQNVTVIDNQNPVITCPPNLTLNAAPNQCGLPSASVAHGTPIVSDNCSIALTTKNSPVMYPIGTTAVLWTVTDNSGLTDTCTQYITILDNQPPTITCPNAVNVSIPVGETAIDLVLTDPIYGDNCAISEITWTLSGATSASSVSTGINILNNFLFNIGITTLTYEITDNHGQSSTCSYSITVVDANAPQIDCPSDTTLYITSTCSLFANLPAAVATDQDGILSLTNSFNNTGDASDVYLPGEYAITWTATDLTGNVNSCVTNISVVDTISPSILCSENIVLSNDTGLCSVSGLLPSAVVADNCTLESVIWSITGATVLSSPGTGINTSGFVELNIGNHEITYTATDVHGNQSACAHIIEVHDVEPPLIVCQDTIFVSTDTGSCENTNQSEWLIAPAVYENCSIASLTNDAPISLPTGITIVSWTATDIHGLQSTCEQVIQVTDTELPYMDCGDTIFVSTAPDQCEITFESIPGISPTYSDNCLNPTLTHNATAILSVGLHTVTWTVTDVNGNSNSCDQIIVVEDNQAPEIFCQDDIIIAASIGECGISADDLNLTPPSYTENCIGAVLTNNAPLFFPIGTTEVIWTVTSVNNQSANCTQLITVFDNQIPNIVCPSNITQSATPGICGVESTDINIGQAIAIDNCSQVSIFNNAPSLFPVGSTEVIWTATDPFNNSISCTQWITITDDEPPVIICPDTIFTQAFQGGCGLPASLVNLTTPYAIDNCSNPTFSSQGPFILDIGINIVQWKAIDEAGNFSVCDQIIVVEDNQFPTITCPSEIEFTASPGLCGANLSDIALINPETSDNCEIATLTHNAPDFLPVGETIVRWTATDLAGNVVSCDQSILISDDENPQIVCPNDIHTVIAEEATIMQVTIPNPTFSDNCAVETLSWSLSGATTGSSLQSGINLPGILTFNMGITTVTMVVTDSHNNSSECSFIVTVTDSNSPQITCPEDILYYLTDSCDIYLSIPTPLVSDNEGIDWTTNSLNNTDDASGEFTAGAYEIIWITSDLTGNQNSCIQSIVVADSIAPVVICPADIVTSSAPDMCGLNIEIPVPAYTDNCDIINLTWTISGATINQSVANGINMPGSVFLNPGLNTIGFIAEDTSGNTSSCTYSILINDSIAPQIQCNANFSETVEPGQCYKTLIIEEPTVFENCGSYILSNNLTGTDPLEFDFTAGITTIQWTAVDASGNSAECIQTVEIIGAIPLSIQCPNDTILANEPGMCYALYDLSSQLIIEGGCEEYTVSHDHIGNDFPVGTTTVTWTITGSAGFEFTCSHQIEVIDSEAPIISTCPANQIQFVDGNCSFILPSFVDSIEVYDNCGGILITQSPAPGTVMTGSDSEQQITLQATDTNGLWSTCSFQIILEDTLAPVINCPADYTGAIQSGCQIWLDFEQPAVSDNCTTPTYSHDYAGGITDQDASAYYNEGVTTITWTATDEAGNSASCIQIVEVLDLLFPEITCQDTTVYIAEDDLNVYLNIAPPFAQDNCLINSITNNYTNSWNANGDYPEGVTEVIWTVVDASDNSNTCIQSIEVIAVDNNGIICHNDTIQTDPGLCGSLVSLQQPVVLELDGTEVFENSLNGGSEITNAFFETGINYINWIVTDANNNTYFCTDTITIVDVEWPVITCPDTLFAISEPEMCGVYLEINTPLTEDNCGISTTIATNTQGAVVYQVFPIGLTDITWITLDYSSNVSSCHQVVVVTAQVPSEIICPGDQIATTETNGTFIIPDYTNLATIHLNCPESEFVTQIPVPGTIISSDTTLTLFLQDGDLAIDSCSFNLNLTNNTAPEFNCPGESITVYYNENCEILVADYRSYLDSSSIIATGEYTIYQYPDTSTILSSLNQVDFWIMDETGLSSDTCSLNIITLDNLPPQINQLDNLEITLLENECEYTFDPTTSIFAEDNCDSDVLIQIIENPSDIWTPGNYNLHYFATDNSGNTSDTLEFNITVIDSTGPIVDSLDTETFFTCDPGFICPEPTFTGCPNEIISVTPMFGALQPGLNTIIWEATDGTNTTSYAYTVNLINTEVIEINASPTICQNSEPVQVSTTSTSQFDITLLGGDIVDTLENQILDPALYPPGNYILTIQPGLLSCIEIVDFEIIILANPEIELTADNLEVCENSIEVNALTNAENIDWNIPSQVEYSIPQNNAVTLNSASDGTFDIQVVADAAGCMAFDTLQVTFWSMPQWVNAGEDQQLYLTAETNIEGTYSSGNEVTWSVLSGYALIEDLNSAANHITNLQTGTNILLFEVSNGLCMKSDSLQIEVYGLAIPNGFSPNGDGTNDAFVINGIENLGKAQLHIYNRWGQLVFESSDYHNEWMGKNQQGELLPDDTYYYELALDQESHQGFVVIKQ